MYDKVTSLIYNHCTGDLKTPKHPGNGNRLQELLDPWRLLTDPRLNRDIREVNREIKPLERSFP